MTDNLAPDLNAQKEALLTTLQDWANLNSGSLHVQGINRFAETIGEYASSALAAPYSIKALPPISVLNDQGDLVSQEIGPILNMQKQWPSKELHSKAAVKVLFCGHMDTVFSKDSHFQDCQRYACLEDAGIQSGVPETAPESVHKALQGAILAGPGVADMKGGLLVMINAIKAVEQSEFADRFDWQILLNSDEEIGSLASAPYLSSAAKTADLGLVFEPSMPDGFLAGARKGSGNFSITVHGKAAHAGRDFDSGRNAITALSLAMNHLHTLNDQPGDTTLNLARIIGGGPNNIVPDLAICHFNIRVSSVQKQQLAEQHIAATMHLLETLNGFSAELNGGFNRPPKEADTAQQKLFSLVELCGRELDLYLGIRPTGGCCDGNNLLAAGLANIDTLGVQGGNIHSDQEYMLVDSLLERTELVSLLLRKVIDDPNRWLKSPASPTASPAASLSH